MSDRGERRNGILEIFPYFDTHSSSGFFGSSFFFSSFIIDLSWLLEGLGGRKGCEEQRNSEEKKNRGGYKRASSITIVTLSLVVSRCNVNLASGDSLQSRRLSLLRDPIPGNGWILTPGIIVEILAMIEFARSVSRFPLTFMFNIRRKGNVQCILVELLKRSLPFSLSLSRLESRS